MPEQSPHVEIVREVCTVVSVACVQLIELLDVACLFVARRLKDFDEQFVENRSLLNLQTSI